MGRLFRFVTVLVIMVMLVPHGAGAPDEPDTAHDRPASTFGGLWPGDSVSGVIDRVFVAAPPHYAFQAETVPGSFLNCGRDWIEADTDRDGRRMVAVRCGVTLTETLTVPAAATSAQIIIHY